MPKLYAYNECEREEKREREREKEKDEESMRTGKELKSPGKKMCRNCMLTLNVNTL